MSNDAKKADIKTETILGRSVETHTKSGVSTYTDTGEIVKPEDREMNALFADATTDFKGLTKQNPDVRFYSLLVRPEGSETDINNKLRGVVVKLDERPESFGAPDDEPSVSSDRTRIMAWVLLTANCYTKTLDKKLELSKPGTMVWVDLNQATMAVLTTAAPKYENGKLVGVVETAINPKYKDKYIVQVDGKNEPRFAWRCDVFGGWNGDPSFKRIEGAALDKIRGKLSIPTLFVSQKDIYNAVHAADATGTSHQLEGAMKPAPQLGANAPS